MLCSTCINNDGCPIKAQFEENNEALGVMAEVDYCHAYDPILDYDFNQAKIWDPFSESYIVPDDRWDS